MCVLCVCCCIRVCYLELESNMPFAYPYTSNQKRVIKFCYDMHALIPNHNLNPCSKAVFFEKRSLTSQLTRSLIHCAASCYTDFMASSFPHINVCVDNDNESEIATSLIDKTIKKVMNLRLRQICVL